MTTSYYLGGKLVAQREDTTLSYIHQDSLNSSSVMTDSSGDQIATTMKYKPFGECRNSPPEIADFPTDKLFTGQRLDVTGLYYYGARYYDCIIGRFISADPVVQNNTGFESVTKELAVNLITLGTSSIATPKEYHLQNTSDVPKNPQSFNRYSYVLNNSLKYTDPAGLNTVAIGLNATGGLCAGADVTIVMVFDDKGNWGILNPPAGGWWIGGSVSAGGIYQWTSADTIFDLEGPSYQIGGSITTGIGVNVGVEFVVGDGYGGFNVNLGVGIGTPEAHGLVGYMEIEFCGNSWWAKMMYNVLTLGLQELVEAFIDEGLSEEIDMPTE